MKNFTLIILALFLAGAAKAQYEGFTQFSSNPVLINPAFAGSAGCSRAVTNLRSESFERRTYGFAYDQYVHPIRSGLGFAYSYFNDGGFFEYQNANFFYSFNFKINDNSNLRTAINAGVGRIYVEEKKIPIHLNTPTNIYVSYPPSEISDNPKYYLNLGAGIIYDYKNFVAGASLDHFNNPDLSVLFFKYRLPAKFNAHVSYQYDVREKFSITPFLMLTKQGEYSSMLYSVLLNKSFLKFGAGFRQGFNNPDALFGMAGYQGKVLSIGYSYEFYVSKLSNATGGAHEINAAFKFNCKNKTDKFNIVKINGF